MVNFRCNPTQGGFGRGCEIGGGYRGVDAARVAPLPVGGALALTTDVVVTSVGGRVFDLLKLPVILTWKAEPTLLSHQL